MATSGTYNFNLPVDEIIEEAMDMVGGEMLNQEDVKSARRSLNLLFKDIQNKWFPLATMVQERITLVEGQSSYSLNSSYLDLIDVNHVRGTQELPMTRRSLLEYHSLPNKDIQGRPSTYTVDKTNPDAPKLIVWTTPENSTDQIDFWAIQKVQDVTNSNQDIDFDSKYLPAITVGLAYYMSLKRDTVSQEKRLWLKQEYAERLDSAWGEDRDRANFYIGLCLNSPLR